MSASEHTPGPWEVLGPVYKPNEVHPTFIIHAEDIQIARVQIEATARLIAAAPDLLEAAAYLLDHADNDPDNGHSAETYNEAWEMLEKAVAKAEGEND